MLWVFCDSLPDNIGMKVHQFFSLRRGPFLSARHICQRSIQRIFTNLEHFFIERHKFRTLACNILEKIILDRCHCKYISKITKKFEHPKTKFKEHGEGMLCSKTTYMDSRKLLLLQHSMLQPITPSICISTMKLKFSRHRKKR